MLALPPGHWARRENSSSGRAMHSSISGRVGVLGHVLDGVEQDRVGPLEVVDDQHQRAAAGQCLQQPLQRPEGVLGQAGVLAEAEELGDPLGDQVAPLHPGQQLGQPGPGLLGRVVGRDPGRLADDLDHRPHGHAVPEGRAVAAQDAGLVAEAGHELVDQPGLPDPGRAEHADQVAGALGGRPLEQLLEQLLLAAPPDHGGDRPPGPAGAVGEHLQQPPDVLRLGCPLDRQRPGRLGLDRVDDQPVGLLAEQDLAGPGQLLEPLGQVDGRAGELLLQGAGVADQHVAGVDAEAHVELEAALLAHLLGKLVQGGAELAGGPHGPQGVVLVQLGDAEGGHEAVAVAFADAGPPVAEGPADGLAVAVEEPLHRERVQLALQLGRLDHVAEDHGDDPELLGGGPGREPVAALGAEPGLVDQAVAAVRASRHASEYMDEQAPEPSCW